MLIEMEMKLHDDDDGGNDDEPIAAMCIFFDEYCGECCRMFICLRFAEFIVLSWPQPWQYDLTQWMVKPRSEDKHKSFIISVEHHCKHSDISITREKMVYGVRTVDWMTLSCFSERKRSGCPKSKAFYFASDWRTIKLAKHILYTFVSYNWLHRKFSAAFNRCVICAKCASFTA